MAKRNHALTLIHSEQGQISIFFSASLIVMISIVAFVINIGLFVKAKINLQNATDAAAYSGAAVQARQLSKIAYLNWEMRNIYKEWLYKYYVIGNLNLEDVENPPSSGTMKFKLFKDKNALTGDETEDPFNIPAVCIHIAGARTNICKRYSIPGLPEFGSTNLAGAEQASRAFMDTLISTKVTDCIDRTRLNMAVATTWTYNVLGNSQGSSFTGSGPAILTDRQGAWPKAVELAIRMRNLEYVVNRPPETNGVCISGSAGSLINCQTSINDISSQQKLGNERIVKAFYSAYRNLGNDQDSEMKNSFTLTEIAPRPVKFDSENNASNFLIPSHALYQKHFLDLKLMMVNYAIFYAAMIPRADSRTSGACDVSKVAIPVPGYPLGFYKNPDVLTYYAVKGEAEFVGMFNPFFGSNNVVKMTAYSAAKPMGGRIGPMLFIQKENDDFFLARNDNLKFRSVPYMTTYDFKGVKVREDTYTGENFMPGLPLPTNSNTASGSFWLELGRPIGGRVADAGGIQFGVPNLVYDYEVDYTTEGYVDPTQKIHKITATASETETKVGLFSPYQFKLFRGNALSPTISPETLDHEIARVRAPTKYESANYLIPSPNDFNEAHNMDSFGFINDPNGKEQLPNGYDRYRARVYAPLFKSNDQEDVLFKNEEDVKNSIFGFMQAQVTGMKKYKMALNSAAKSIFKQQENVTSGAAGSKVGYARAAKAVSDIDFNNDDLNQTPASCESIAGEFLSFYWGDILPSEVPEDNTNCPVPMKKLFDEYFSSKTPGTAAYDPTYYNMDFSWKSNQSKEEGMQFMSAYAPGTFTGSSREAIYVSPFPGVLDGDTMQRNTYSTKFISLDSLRAGSSRSYSVSTPIMSEGDISPTPTETSQNNFRNPLEAESVGLDLDSIKY